MGRKKTLRSKMKRKSAKSGLESRFNCPECSNENVVQCKVDKKINRGTAYCTICNASFTCKINNLSQPIDVYSNWIDNLNENN
ncbi:hypothetical protein H311_03242 [Anncaliia algerae PRA109]|nr:hypothetical protein H311_03242 [Anncaliia algerae PRA109]